jgi:uncharacterized protein YcgI (DUF1989 family)
LPITATGAEGLVVEKGSTLRVVVEKGQAVSNR